MIKLEEVLVSYRKFTRLLAKKNMAYEYETISCPEYVVFQISFGMHGTDFKKDGYVITANVAAEMGGIFSALKRAYDKGVEFLKEVK